MSVKKLIKDEKQSNKEMKEKIEEFLRNLEIEGAHQKIKFSNIEIKDPEVNFNEMEKAVTDRKSILSKVYADAEVINKHTGNVLDRKRIYLGGIPYKNALQTYIIEGNHYSLPHQFRLKPAGYTSVKNNNDIETMFNLKGAKSFKITKPNNKDELVVEFNNRKIPLYDVLKLLGKTDEDIKRELGHDVLNILKLKSKPDRSYKSLAKALGVVDEAKANTPEGLEQIRQELMKGEVDPEAVHHIFGIKTTHMNGDLLLKAAKKTVQVAKGEADPVDKENLMYKRVITPEELIVEGIHKHIKSNLWKKRAPLNAFKPAKVEDVIDEPILSEASKRFISTAAISRLPEGYNPLQLKQISADITPMGEGGIKSTETITPSMRGLHMSHLGFIDPIKSPEGANTGITLSLTEGAYIDKNNNPAIKVKNLKTGKYEIVPIKDLWDKKVAFPDPSEDGSVGIRHKDNIYTGKLKEADYQIPSATELYGPAMNSLGLLSANDPTRNLMASKHILQALPLKDRDNPNVIVYDEKNDNIPIAEYAKQHLPTAPTSGTVVKIEHDKGLIHIKGDNGKIYKQYYSNTKVPLNSKTYLEHYPIVKVGDRVKKGDILAESNYTKNGQFALGKNLRTAFLMMPGTRNDAIIVSESAAKKMTSLHTSKHIVEHSKDIHMDKKKFITLFPELAKKIDLDKYDEHGFLKPGEVVHKGEPIYIGVRKVDEDEIKFANEKVKKLLYGGYVPHMEEWKYQDPATAEKINKMKGKTTILMHYESPLREGDKLAGRSGNKGIVSKVLPDELMPRTEDGKPIEIILGGAGVASRQNPAQVIEATLGAVAEKTGKQYAIPHHVDEHLAKFALNEAKKHNVQLYHKVYDPKRKIWLKQPVFVGNYHIQKLFKQGDTAWSGVGYGAVDGLDQPKKGGKSSASSISNMEVNALLVHGAKDFLRETFKIRSQKNRDWFSAFMNGSPMLPTPEEKTSLKKFKHLLMQMHINVKEDDKGIELVPMTDKDVLRMSNGQVKEPFGLQKNSLKEIKKGFYDPHIFGGNGENFGHIDLGVKVINPNFIEPIARLSGRKVEEIEELAKKGEIDKIEEIVKKIPLSKKEKELKETIKRTKNPTTINQSVRMLKLIKKLKSNNLKLDEVAFISKVPVLPTKFRPISKLPNGTIVNHDINQHYSTIISSANTLNEAKNKLGDNHALVKKLKGELQQHIGALYGMNESPDPTLVKQEVKSVPEIIAGKKPKESFWQKHVLQNRVFTSGRAVIVPKEKYLSMNEVEIPKEIAWRAFEPHLRRRFAQMGMDTKTIEENIEKRTPLAKQHLEEIMKEVPIVINRAPTLHKHSMIGVYAKISPDNTMVLSPLQEDPLNADYDGDQLAIHVPLTPESIKDVKEKMLAEKQIFGHRNNDNLQFKINLDPYIGFYHATKYGDNNKSRQTLRKKV